MAKAILITGGNMGVVTQNIAAARELIAQRVGDVVAQSSVMESQAWGLMEESGDGMFLNQVLAVDTELSPMELLRVIQEIECELGRERDDRKVFARDGEQQRVYKSRTMDIDILLYDDQVVDMDELKIPHPMMSEREFVLRPLSEILPQYIHPKTGLTVAEMLNNLVVAQNIKKSIE